MDALSCKDGAGTGTGAGAVFKRGVAVFLLNSAFDDGQRLSLLFLRLLHIVHYDYFWQAFWASDCDCDCDRV